MIYEKLSELIKKHFYVVFFEKFKSETSSTTIDRYIAKHPLLRPELIVINDQIQGFKKIKENYKSLEAFPVFVEIECSEDAFGEKLIDSIELYAEVEFNSNKGLSEIVNVSNVYSKTISLEKINKINSTEKTTYIIHSKISDVIHKDFFNNELAGAFISDSEIELMLEVNLVSFTNFIKLLDEILVKGKSLSAVEHIFKIL